MYSPFLDSVYNPWANRSLVNTIPTIDLIALFKDSINSTIGEQRPLYDLQYIESAGGLELVNAALTPTCFGTKPVEAAQWDRTVPGKFIIDVGKLWSWSITFDDGNISTYEYATILSSTSAICFDTSGNGRPLMITVADTSLVCKSGKEVGSDHLFWKGWTFSDGETMYYDDYLQSPIPAGIIVPIVALGDHASCYTYVI